MRVYGDSYDDSMMTFLILESLMIEKSYKEAVERFKELGSGKPDQY
jgi:hypothetical protein